MATSYEPWSLAERADIHKSCKSLETLLNVLNDYCEAIGNASVLQKKLAKALRETAGMNITGEIARNAMNASAVIFDALSDIDAKFAKLADKEFDGISAEVKKWFKKLAKEEKTHDERMSNANAKIKQAGQVYEKKYKKGARDVTEEHTRYVNLISTLGPEMSQEKYNHALNVTQRHTSATYNTAACLSRVADAEWLRVFESVRRFSPAIGQLGEWRALCEGGWIGPIPQGLPNLDESQRPQPDRVAENERRPEDNEHQAPTMLQSVAANELSHETNERSLPLPVNNITTEPQGLLPSPWQSPTLARPNQSYPSSESVVQDHLSSARSPPLDRTPPRPFAGNNNDSIRSLSAFPSPPTHFPLSPPRQQLSQSQSSQSSSSYLKPRLTESPLPGEDDDSPQISSSSHKAQRGSPGALSPVTFVQEGFQEKHPVTEVSDATAGPLGDTAKRPIPGETQAPSYSPTEPSAPSVDVDPRTAVHARGDYVAGTDQYEFGGNLGYKPKARTMDNVRSTERSDTLGSNGSMVAAMRHRYSIPAESTSVAPKDVPRLPLSVSGLASRYQPVDRPGSSPPPPRQLPLVPSTSGTLPHQPDIYQGRIPPGDYNSELSSASANPARDDEVSRQRRDEHAELKLKGKQTELRERGREIDMWGRELERERVRLMNAREEPAEVNMTNGSQHKPEPQLRPLGPLRRRSQMDIGQTSAKGSNNVAPISPLRPRYSPTTTHLAPPSPSMSSSQASSSPGPRQAFLHSGSSSRQSSQQHEDKPPHAPSCGCETCSVAKYRSPPTSQPLDFRPPAKPLSLRPVEKSKPGWIRRLSMPVGNAFNLDSKKGISNIEGLGSRKRSTTSLGTVIHQDGRKSYEANAMRANRSMTNLGMGGRQ